MLRYATSRYVRLCEYLVCSLSSPLQVALRSGWYEVAPSSGGSWNYIRELLLAVHNWADRGGKEDSRGKMAD